jgi:hypothetical protein
MPSMRARQRPRKRSVNFRRLWWVVTREAALRILCPDLLPESYNVEVRRQLCTTRLDRIRAVTGVLLAMHPERRVWPPLRSSAVHAAAAEFFSR